MNPLSPTTFSVGPSDNYAALDVYSSSGQVVNSIQDKTTSGLSFDPRTLLANGGRGSIGSAGSLLKMAGTGGVTLNQTAILSRLAASAPMIASSLRGMTGSAQQQIANTFQDSGRMNFNMGGSVYQIPSSSYSDAMAYGDYATTVNNYSSGLVAPSDPMSCSVYDIDAHASMISGGVIQGSNLGIPSSYQFMTSAGSVSQNQSLLTKVCTASIPILVKNGDLGNLSNLAGGTGGRILSAAFPTYASSLKTNYTYNRYGGSTMSGAPLSDYTNLVSIFTGADPRWNVIDRIGDATGTDTNTPTWNAIKLIAGSREFNELIAVGVKNLIDGSPVWWQIVARTLPQTTVDQEIRLFFPKCWQDSFLQPQIKKKNVMDPRVANLLGVALGTALGTRNQKAANARPLYSPGYTPQVQSNYPSYPSGIMGPPQNEYDDYGPTPDVDTSSFDSSSLTNPTLTDSVTPEEGTGGLF